MDDGNHDGRDWLYLKCVREADRLEISGDWLGAGRALTTALAVADRENASSEAVLEAIERFILWKLKYDAASSILPICERESCGASPHTTAHRALLMSHFGAALSLAGKEWSRATESLLGGYQLARACGQARARAYCAIAVAFGVYLPKGMFAEAAARLDEAAILLCNDKSATDLIAHIHAVRSLAAAMSGRPVVIDGVDASPRTPFVDNASRLSRAKIHLRRAETRWAREVINGIPAEGLALQLKPWFNMTGLLIEVASHDLISAEASAHEMMGALRSVGFGIYAPACFLALSVFLFAKGDWDEAHRILYRNLELCTSSGFTFWHAQTHMMLARFAHAEGKPEQVKNHVKQALALADVPTLAEVWSGHTAVRALLFASAKSGIERKRITQLFAMMDTERSNAVREIRVHIPDNADCIDVWRGQRIVLTPQSQRLLRGLAMRHPRPVSIEELAELLWRDAQLGSEVYRRLAVAIHRLRDALHPKAWGQNYAIVSHRGFYALTENVHLGSSNGDISRSGGQPG